jgi:hypothetical protein
MSQAWQPLGRRELLSANLWYAIAWVFNAAPCTPHPASLTLTLMGAGSHLNASAGASRLL